jgi:hypothetical protein
VEGADDALSVEDTTPGSKPLHILTVTLKATSPGELNRTFRVLTDLKDEGTVEFQARGEIVR